MAALYRLNGILLSSIAPPGLNSLVPSGHSTMSGEVTKHETIGGIIMVEPVSGLRRRFVWHYDQRSTMAIYRLFELIGDSPLTVIDTYVHERTPEGVDVLLRDVEVVFTPGELKSLQGRSSVDSFSLTFEEIVGES